jgi:hypothetical protein
LLFSDERRFKVQTGRESTHPPLCEGRGNERGEDYKTESGASRKISGGGENKVQKRKHAPRMIPLLGGYPGGAGRWLVGAFGRWDGETVG